MRALITLALACSLGVVANAASEAPAMRRLESASQANQVESKGSRSLNPSSSASTAPARGLAFNSQSATKESAMYSEYLSHEWWLVYLTGGLVAVTAALAWYTASLYQATVALGAEAKATSEEQARGMSASIREAARAADNLGNVAQATFQQVEHFRQVAERQLRAYIGVRHAVLRVRRLPEGDKILAEITIVNAGQTTARHAKLAIHIGLFDPEDRDFPVQYRDGETHLAPAFEWNAQQASDFFLSGGLEAQLLRRSKLAVIWGEISYVDAFDVARRSTFRFRQGMVEFDATGRPGAWDVYPCVEGNDAT
jgi:hypothetical protein